MRRTSVRFVAFAALAALADLTLPDHGRGVPIAVFTAVAAACMVHGLRLHRPAGPLPWYLLLVTLTAGVLAVAAHVAAGDEGLDLAPPAQTLVAMSLVTWLLGSALFVRARTRILDRYQLLDLGIFLISAVVALKRLVLDPALESHPPVGMSPGLSMAYILMQVVALVLFVRFTTLPGPRPPAMWLLLGSLATSVFGSLLTNVVSPELGLHLASFVSATGTVLATLHPSMVQLTAPSPGDAPRFGAVRTAALGAALVLAPVTEAVRARDGELSLGWFLGPTVVVTILVLVRLRLVFAQERTAQAELRASRAQFRALIHGISDVVLVFDDDDVVWYASASSATTLGRTRQILMGRHVSEVVLPDDVELALGVLAATRGSGGSASVQVRVPVDGEVRTFEASLTDRVDDPNITGVIVVLHDITDRSRLEAQLRHQALHDTLTGLPNRALLADRVADALALGGEVGVLFVDLDDFKAVNDGLGHTLGDELLRAVGERLCVAVRDGDLVARLGGDEFAVLVGGEGARDVATRLLEAFVEPFEVQGHRIAVSASVGVAAGCDTTVDELLSNADVAMYRAKSDGKGSLTVFEPAMQTRASERLLVQLELADALRDGQLRLLYQPIMELASGRLLGAEALLRWEHPSRGLLGPERFIPIAEATGQIIGMGEWVLAEACRQAATWPDDVHVAVNLSARQLESEAVVHHVTDALARAGVAAERLVVEITETMLARDVEATDSHLRQLGALGVRIAVDDFGTGYSSLSTLSRFPVDILKIDRSFIASMLDNPEASALVHVLLEMGRALHLDVVAEGIEEAAQADALRQQGCGQGQGFYFARPLSGAAFAALAVELRAISVP